MFISRLDTAVLLVSGDAVIVIVAGSCAGAAGVGTASPFIPINSVDSNVISNS